jgi:DNA-nicking Smr family endonuclease
VKERISAFGKGYLRRLSPEEIELWLAVAKTVAPRPSSTVPQLPRPDASTAPAESRESNRSAPPGKTQQQKPPLVQQPKIPPLAPLERRLRQKLSRGRAAPEAAIDLHGMRRQEAFGALRQFLARAQREGAKIVLVVTGKGDRSGSEERTAGVLRRQVPQWLSGPEYHSIVVGFEEAARPHGGAGALYVRIRRRDRVITDKHST